MGNYTALYSGDDLGGITIDGIASIIITIGKFASPFALIGMIALMVYLLRKR